MFWFCINLTRFTLTLTHAHSIRKTQVEERVLNSHSANETQRNLRRGRNMEEKEQKGEERYIFAWKEKERINLMERFRFLFCSSF